MGKMMQASEAQLDVVKLITDQTIKEIYPKYYTAGEVEFFLSHHNDRSIQEDIFAEKNIFKHYSKICLASSVPAKEIYLKRGYKKTETQTILTETEESLCYDVMKKYKKYKA